MDNAEKDIFEARMNDGAPESGIYSEGVWNNEEVDNKIVKTIFTELENEF